MKRILIVAMLFLPGALLAGQGQGQDRQAQAAQKLQQVAQQLNLSPEQKLKLIPILKAEAPKIEAIKADTSLSPIQKMEQVKAVHDETDPQVKSILTPEQYQTLQRIRREEIQQAIRNRRAQ
jgi:hypothetical protein